MRKRSISTKKIVFLSLLTAMALVISLLEQAMPLPIGVPGAKLGLSNLVILTTIVVYGAKEGMAVALLKSVLLLLLTGSVTGFWYSIAGALFSSAVMSIAVRFALPPFSLVGVSELGALAHNVGQLCVACVVLQNGAIFVYLPVLTLAGLFTGFFVGLSANALAPSLRRAVEGQSEGRIHEKQESTEGKQ
ncbi:Gx transporter family protein [Murdochiella vaginalis]|uniref:Gx transporter family protein n=1 Tax=Murdochiella vaginalis TaxID=1852373 RepID=UPI0008FE329B|nr:Gx transporter family protein [Murdochiella vaginalis]